MAEFTPNVLTNIGLDSHLNLSQTYMGRAAKLKRQRKQDRLSSPPLPTTPTQVVSPSERDIEREVSDFSDWLGDFRERLYLTTYRLNISG